MTEMGKWHTEEQCTQNNYTMFTWSTYWDQNKKMNNCARKAHTEMTVTDISNTHTAFIPQVKQSNNLPALLEN
jgi:hypothetical protein